MPLMKLIYVCRVSLFVRKLDIDNPFQNCREDIFLLLLMFAPKYSLRLIKFLHKNKSTLTRQKSKQNFYSANLFSIFPSILIVSLTKCLYLGFRQTKIEWHLGHSNVPRGTSFSTAPVWKLA